MNKNVRACILEAIRKNKALSASICVMIIAIAVVSLAPPQILRIIIDTKLAPKIATGLGTLAVIYLATLVANFVLEAAKEGILVIFGQKITKSIRISMADKAKAVRAQQYTATSSGEISSRFLSDVDKIGELFTSGVASMAVDCFKIIGIVGSIFFFSRGLGFMVLALVPCIAVITRVFQKSILRAQKKNRVYIGILSRHISESIKNMRTIKLGGREEYAEQKYSDCLTQNFYSMDKVNFFDSIYSPIILMVRAISICVLVLSVGGGFGFLNITLGMVAASIELISSLFAPVERLGMELATIQSAFSGVARVNEFFALEEAAPATQAVQKIVQTGEPIIEFRDVDFSYNGQDNVLSGVNFAINRGESVSFSGRTGAGKTTIFNLVAGLYAPTKGSVALCGIECSQLCPEARRELMGYVCQSFDYIPGNIKNQITLGDAGVSDGAVFEAAKLVGMHEKILSLPKGYDTQVELGECFSQGEKQLLSIARAVCRKPKILLLDEITAGLDSGTEAKIMDVLQKVRKNYTILTISHRLTSMLFCDKVVLLENNKAHQTDIPKN